MEAWKDSMGSKGMKVNMNKTNLTKVMISGESSKRGEG